MRNDKYLKALLKKNKGFAKRAACVGLAGCMLAGGNSLVAQAATLDDVFDAEQYADDYADLKAAFGYDRAALLNHYKTYGILEGRHVSGLIDIAKYREAYPDLYAAFGDDWNAYVEHFLTFGILEGRDSGTDFDVRAYAERYADLKEALGDDFLALYQHYRTVGKAEGRIATTTVAAPASTPAPSTSVSSSGNTSTSSSASSSGNESTPGSGSTSGSQTGAHTETTYDSEGHKVVNEYDDNGRLVVSTTYYEDDKIKYQVKFDSAGNPIESIQYDTDGKITLWVQYEYFSDGKSKKITVYNADGTTKNQTEFGTDGSTKDTLYESDRKIVNERNSAGNLTFIATYWNDGSSTEIAYELDENGVCISGKGETRDENGKLTEECDYHYEDGKEAGYVRTTYHEDGSYTVSEYDATGFQQSSKTYDKDGNEI